MANTKTKDGLVEKSTGRKIVSPLDFILKKEHVIERQRVYHAGSVVSGLFVLLCSRKDNPMLAKQYKEQIDSIIDEFSPFIFPERQ